MFKFFLNKILQRGDRKEAKYKKKNNRKIKWQICPIRLIILITISVILKVKDF